MKNMGKSRKDGCISLKKNSKGTKLVLRPTHKHTTTANICASKRHTGDSDGDGD